MPRYVFKANCDIEAESPVELFVKLAEFFTAAASGVTLEGQLEAGEMSLSIRLPNGLILPGASVAVN